MIEIERKFLVRDIEFLLEPEIKKQIESVTYIKQGYLVPRYDECTLDPFITRVRIQTCNGTSKALLIVKSYEEKLERFELNSEIDLDSANYILHRLDDKAIIEKYRVKLDRWEIDIFNKELLGLCMAEIELTNKEEEIEIPSWIKKEVTGDFDYYNHNLISYSLDCSKALKEKIQKVIKELY